MVKRWHHLRKYVSLRQNRIFKHRFMHVAVKIWIRIALQFYCGKIRVDMSAIPPESAATIIAANHPNAFLDALIIAAYYPRKLKFMARGDAFKNPLLSQLLNVLGLIPYHTGSIAANDAFYKTCLGALSAGGSLLVFPEGISKHTDNLRPLQKPVATLAHNAVTAGITNLILVPLYIRYSSFGGFPESVSVHACAPEGLQQVSESSLAAFTTKFNEQLSEALQDCRQRTVAGIDTLPTNRAAHLLWAIPGLAGYLLHWPLVKIVKALCANYKNRDGAYYDSVLFIILAALYPLLLITMLWLSFAMCNMPLAISTLAAPVTAWSYKKYKASKHLR